MEGNEYTSMYVMQMWPYAQSGVGRDIHQVEILSGKIIIINNKLLVIYKEHIPFS